jgi:hypothetical protein
VRSPVNPVVEAVDLGPDVDPDVVVDDHVTTNVHDERPRRVDVRRHVDVLRRRIAMTTPYPDAVSDHTLRSHPAVTGAAGDRRSRLVVLEKQRDGQAVELGVRALRDDLVHDLVIGMAADPVGDQLPEELTLFGFCRGKDFHASHVDNPSLVLRS